MPKRAYLCLFSIDTASVQSSISQPRILFWEGNVGMKFHKTRPLGQLSVPLVFIQTETTIRSRRGNSDLHRQIKR